MNKKFIKIVLVICLFVCPYAQATVTPIDAAMATASKAIDHNKTVLVPAIIVSFMKKSPDYANDIFETALVTFPDLADEIRKAVEEYLNGEEEEKIGGSGSQDEDEVSDSPDDDDDKGFDSPDDDDDKGFDSPDDDDDKGFDSPDDDDDKGFDSPDDDDDKDIEMPDDEDIEMPDDDDDEISDTKGFGENDEQETLVSDIVATPAAPVVIGGGGESNEASPN